MKEQKINVPVTWLDGLLELGFSLAGKKRSKAWSFRAIFVRTYFNVFADKVFREDSYQAILRIGRSPGAQEFRVTVPMTREYNSREEAEAAPRHPIGEGYASICMEVKLTREMKALLTGG